MACLLQRHQAAQLLQVSLLQQLCHPRELLQEVVQEHLHRLLAALEHLLGQDLSVKQPHALGHRHLVVVERRAAQDLFPLQQHAQAVLQHLPQLQQLLVILELLQQLSAAAYLLHRHRVVPLQHHGLLRPVVQEHLHTLLAVLEHLLRPLVARGLPLKLEHAHRLEHALERPLKPPVRLEHLL